MSLIYFIKTFISIKVYQKYISWVHFFGAKINFKKSDEKILIVIAHVVDTKIDDLSYKLIRLQNCLDGLLDSFASYDFKIVLLSKDGYSLSDLLPEYQKSIVNIYFSPQIDPMEVEYDAYDVFKKHKDDFDYFLFIEDDIILKDSWILEKNKEFIMYFKNINYILVPHRYEFDNGKKYFIDQAIFYNQDSVRFKYLKNFGLKYSNGLKFCIYENPHAAFYLLNKEQVNKWVRSGYKWKYQNIAFGKLESAATFCLHENFIFFKTDPHFCSFYEVQHYGNKYINSH